LCFDLLSDTAEFWGSGELLGWNEMHIFFSLRFKYNWSDVPGDVGRDSVFYIMLLLQSDEEKITHPFKLASGEVAQIE